MPATVVLAFRDPSSATPPITDWLLTLKIDEPKRYAKCLQSILRLGACGHELRRPEADILRDGIYELRPVRGAVNFRILYFFCGKNLACLSHGFKKKGSAVPIGEIESAIQRKNLVAADRARYTARWEIQNESQEDDDE